jgi:hypothetical protein
MLLPLRLLLTLRISLKQKLGLSCLFSLGIIVVVFAFIRLSKVIKATAESKTDPTTMADAPIILSLWSTIEAAVAVVVANLPAFRSIIRNRGNTGISDSKRERNTAYPTTVGTKVNTSRSAIMRRDVELESLHSFEDEIGGKSKVRVRDIERAGEGDIVMTKHVSVELRQRLEGATSERPHSTLSLPLA